MPAKHPEVDSVLDAQLQRCSTILPVTYANWLDFNSVIEVSNFSFVNPKTNREYTRVILYDDEVHNEACKRAEAHLEALYTQATSVRQVVVFEPAPPLSKSVMRVPVGINASSYDLCSSVVRGRPRSRARPSRRSAVAVQLEASFDDATFERFKEECAQPASRRRDGRKWWPMRCPPSCRSSARTASTDEPKFCPTVCK